MEGVVAFQIARYIIGADRGVDGGIQCFKLGDQGRRDHRKACQMRLDGQAGKGDLIQIGGTQPRHRHPTIALWQQGPLSRKPADGFAHWGHAGL